MFALLIHFLDWFCFLFFIFIYDVVVFVWGCSHIFLIQMLNFWILSKACNLIVNFTTHLLMWNLYPEYPCVRQREWCSVDCWPAGTWGSLMPLQTATTFQNAWNGGLKMCGNGMSLPWRTKDCFCLWCGEFKRRSVVCAIFDVTRVLVVLGFLKKKFDIIPGLIHFNNWLRKMQMSSKMVLLFGLATRKPSTQQGLWVVAWWARLLLVGFLPSDEERILRKLTN